MKVFHNLDFKLNKDKSRILTIGAFDGIHIGHRSLLERMLELKGITGCEIVVYSFSNNPKQMENRVNLILSNNQKTSLLDEMKIDYLIMPQFDEFHKNIEYDDFVKDILIEKLNMKHLVLGHDFRFGKGAKGNIDTIDALSKRMNFSYEIIDAQMVDNMRVSSTLIRDFLMVGDIEEVNKFLGRPHCYVGTVISGKRLGNKIGFPTANLSVDNSMDSLKPGVYITSVVIENNEYVAVTNIGYNPTFEQKSLNLETHIIDFNGDLYEKEIKVKFHKRIRDEMKFKSIDELIKYINRDVTIARDYFSSLHINNSMLK
jgi:riboflavin kinase/FMN adenylyltransferase